MRRKINPIRILYGGAFGFYAEMTLARLCDAFCLSTKSPVPQRYGLRNLFVLRALSAAQSVGKGYDVRTLELISSVIHRVEPTENVTLLEAAGRSIADFNEAVEVLETCIGEHIKGATVSVGESIRQRQAHLAELGGLPFNTLVYSV